MADTIQLEIVTPERLVVNEAVEYIEIPGKTGYLGVLPGHAPLISELAAGELTYRMGNQTKRVAVAWGFAEVLQDQSHDFGGDSRKSRRDRYGARRGGKEKSRSGIAKSRSGR